MKKDPAVPNDPRPRRGDAADAAIARLMRRDAAGDVVAPGPECVEPEQLAAWTERRLRGDEAEHVERHVASCMRCQAALGLLMHLQPAVPAAPVESWWARWRMAWLAPATVAVTALLVWVVWPPPSAPPPAQTMAGVERERVIVLPEPQVATAIPPDSASARGGTGGAAGFGGQQGQAGTRLEPGGRVTGAAEPQVARAAPPPVAISPPPEPPSTPPPPVPPPAALPPPVSTSPPAQRAQAADNSIRNVIGDIHVVVAQFTSRGDSPGMRPDVAAGAQSRAGQGAGRGGRGGGGGGGAAVRLTQAPPAGPVHWRILGNGSVERAIESPPIWQRVDLPDGVMVTAGDAPSPGVVWFVGREGVVLRSRNAAQFERVVFPERTDLSSVRALDAQQASVTTIDSRTYITMDGGATWRPQDSSGGSF
jgi:hypothetical protein